MQVTYCSGALVDVLVKAGAHQYVDYQLIDERYSELNSRLFLLTDAYVRTISI